MSARKAADVARELAQHAHGGQVDKVGRPYFAHPERVARRVAGNPDAVAVAYLHDVVEDTAVSLDDLRAEFPEPIVEAVDAITRRPGETPDAYYQRVKANPLALRVKLADIADNADPTRLALLDERTATRLRTKYAKALEALDDRPDDSLTGGGRYDNRGTPAPTPPGMVPSTASRWSALRGPAA